MLAGSIGAGFLSGIVAGFIAGYATDFLSKHIKLPNSMAGLKPVLILPLLGCAVTSLLMIYVVGTPVKIALDALTAWLTGMQQTSALILGLILGAMMAFDMGGPINKSAYAFSVGLIDSELYTPMATVMAAGMTPPWGWPWPQPCSRTVSPRMSRKRVKRPGYWGPPSLRKRPSPLPPAIRSG